jgi:hypothetical protein
MRVMRRLGAAGVAIVALSAASGVWASDSRPRAVEVPIAAGTARTHYPALYSVACTAPGSCAAVGSVYASVGSREIAISAADRGGSWHPATALATPTDALMRGPALGWALSCPPGGPCVAFGTYTSAAGTQLMQSTRRNGRWSAASRIALPVAVGVGRRAPANFGGVFCTGPGDCVATLIYGPDASSRALIVTETGGAWRSASEIALPPLDGLREPVLRSVACAAAGDCVAVGQFSSGAADVDSPILATEQGGRWGRAMTIAPPAGTSASSALGGAYLRAVACPAAGSCTAIGSYRDARYNSRPFVITQTRGTWGPATPLPLPTDALPPARGFGIAEAYALACARHAHCAVVGTYTVRSRDSEALVETETGGRWSASTRVTLPPGAVAASGGQQTVLLGVAADGRGYDAVGYYHVHSGGTAAMALRFAP